MKIIKITKNESYNLYINNGRVITTPVQEVPFLNNPQEIELFAKTFLLLLGIAAVADIVRKI